MKRFAHVPLSPMSTSRRRLRLRRSTRPRRRRRKSERSTSICTGTLVLWLTSTPVRRRRRNEFCTTRASRTRSVKFTRVLPRWIGWNRNRNAGLPSRPPQRRALGRITELTSSSTYYWLLCCARSFASGRLTVVNRNRRYHYRLLSSLTGRLQLLHCPKQHAWTRRLYLGG